ncbi:hypothetical protein THASP1DRAFT_23489 [Thamnocephalis sphaerospora]|uniref:Uncharacterized protein n=1 Tax=Thamnocephalis sphaerospora TaxID=78915 RepID=A0A4P9XRG4_9FUNG|nr:hypothetical protein THASP1DRAFT_23489 [Thamnocephalis sphaerospora]|eukprot:RKP08532.1 hypothetical protein THASP1DRAFT_23489 [Thamnocephalis sphaerospora]
MENAFGRVLPTTAGEGPLAPGEKRELPSAGDYLDPRKRKRIRSVAAVTAYRQQKWQTGRVHGVHFIATLFNSMDRGDQHDATLPTGITAVVIGTFRSALALARDWLVLLRVPGWNDFERRDSLIGLTVRYLAPGEVWGGLESVEQRITTDLFAEMCTLGERLAQLDSAQAEALLSKARQHTSKSDAEDDDAPWSLHGKRSSSFAASTDLNGAQQRQTMLATHDLQHASLSALNQEDERDMDEDDMQQQLVSTVGGISYDTDISASEPEDAGTSDMTGVESSRELSVKNSALNECGSKTHVPVNPAMLTCIIDDDADIDGTGQVAQ